LNSTRFGEEMKDKVDSKRTNKGMYYKGIKLERD